MKESTSSPHKRSATPARIENKRPVIRQSDKFFTVKKELLPEQKSFIKYKNAAARLLQKGENAAAFVQLENCSLLYTKQPLSYVNQKNINGMIIEKTLENSDLKGFSACLNTISKMDQTILFCERSYYYLTSIFIPKLITLHEVEYRKISDNVIEIFKLIFPLADSIVDAVSESVKKYETINTRKTLPTTQAEWPLPGYNPAAMSLLKHDIEIARKAEQISDNVTALRVPASHPSTKISCPAI